MSDSADRSIQIRRPNHPPMVAATPRRQTSQFRTEPFRANNGVPVRIFKAVSSPVSLDSLRRATME
jgi:hypothetical protein